jgi:hypothetical protein
MEFVMVAFGSGEVTSIISVAVFAISGESFGAGTTTLISSSGISSIGVGARALCVEKKYTIAITIRTMLLKKSVFFIKEE